MRILNWIIVFLMVTSGVCFTADDPSIAKSTYDRYKVIYEQNVFSRDRRPPRQDEPSSRQVRTTTVLSIYVLRGIAAEASRGHRFALVEEQISGESKRVGVGTTILGGRIKDIHLNYVLFEEDGTTRKIRVGEEFGKASSTVVTTASEPADTNEPTGDALPKEEKADESPPTDENELLKKLMERRKQELGT